MLYFSREALSNQSETNKSSHFFPKRAGCGRELFKFDVIRKSIVIMQSSRVLLILCITIYSDWNHYSNDGWPKLVPGNLADYRCPGPANHHPDHRHASLHRQRNDQSGLDGVRQGQLWSAVCHHRISEQHPYRMRPHHPDAASHQRKTCSLEISQQAEFTTVSCFSLKLSVAWSGDIIGVRPGGMLMQSNGAHYISRRYWH